MLPDWLTTRCLPGWRGMFCVIDNLVPHRNAVNPDELEIPAREGPWPFRWLCWLHDKAGWW